MRALLVAILRFGLRIFFRRVETAGIERVPLHGPVMFVLNHPNSLVDPVFVLCLAPRKVSFLAKAPLFRIPLVGSLVRGVGSIPVERRQDPGADLSKNREMFDRVGRGALVARFPADPRGVLYEVARRRLAFAIESGWSIPDATHRFWNGLALAAPGE